MGSPISLLTSFGMRTSYGHPRTHGARVAMTVIAYALSSLGGVFVNKTCMSSFNFAHTPTLLLSQLIMSISALTVLRMMGVARIRSLRNIHEMTRLVIPVITFVANVTLGLVALRLVNIPMFSAFRRLSVLSVLLVDWLAGGVVPPRRILAPITVMIFGSFLAGLGDVAYDPLGYALVFANNFLTAGNLVALKRAASATQLSALAMFYHVSALSLPAVFFIAIISGDLRSAVGDVYARDDLRSVGFVFALVLSAASAFLINFFTNLCTQLTSPLTTAITGQMKNILQTVLGIFAFSYVVTPLNAIGLVIALSGSCLFAQVKYIDACAARKQTAALAANVGRGDTSSLPSALNTTTLTAKSTSDFSREEPKARVLRSIVKYIMNFNR